MKENYFKNESVEMWIEDGIVYAVHSSWVTITLEVAKANVANRLELVTKGKTYPFFADVRHAKTMTKEARTYLASSEGVKGISAGAFLIKTQIEAFIVNTFLKLYPMKLPTRVFTKESEAIAWLQFYKNQN